MKTGIYTIYDRKSAIYQFPYQFHNDDVALRACQDLINKGNHSIADHPADYIMFKLGEYDDNEGVFLQLTTKEIICEFHHLKSTIPSSDRYDYGLNSTPKEAVPTFDKVPTPTKNLNGEQS
ncbi:nonstructural protein [Microviridae sp.]|nr:nonstructural protein [Microviridae sp.]